MDNKNHNKRAYLSSDKKDNFTCPSTGNSNSWLSSSTDYKRWAIMTGQRPRPCLNAWHRLTRHSD